MRTICTGAAAFVLAGLASPALAQAPAAQPTASTTATSPTSDRNDPNRMQCRKEQLPGVLPRYKKVCKTKAEWDAEDKQASAETC